MYTVLYVLPFSSLPIEVPMEEQAAEAWVPWQFQLSNWAVEPPAWSPAGCFPASESIDIYGTSSSWIPDNSAGGKQLIEYYAAATQQDYPITEKEAQAESLEVVLHNMELENYINDPIRLFQEVAQDLETATNEMSMKMHRYPIIIRDLDDKYTVPRTVAIGPYHHTRKELKKVDQVKHVAAYHCIEKAECSVPEMYGEVASAADEVHRLYDKDVMAGFSRDDFRHMMFYDACFLVQFMAWYINVSEEKAMDPPLHTFFYSNRSGIYHDVWLLENQLPWRVVLAVMNMMFSDVDKELKKFVGPWRHLLRDSQPLKEKDFDWDDSYRPPHLLALLRYYIVGRRDPATASIGNVSKLKSHSFSVSAIELAKIGITLKANDTPELTNMGLGSKKKILRTKLSLAPLSLHYVRASRLVNMAAFELCTTPRFMRAQPEDSAVCSYLVLLSMLVNRVEDVHELRKKGVLQGGGGLTDKQALAFFTSLQSLPNGRCCADTMLQIESYRVDNKVWTKIYSFIYTNGKTILKVVSAIGVFIGILSAFVTISEKLKPFKSAP